MERLEAVRVSQNGDVSRNSQDDLKALDMEGQGNVPKELLFNLFASWWQEARQKALAEVQRRASFH